MEHGVDPGQRNISQYNRPLHKTNLGEVRYKISWHRHPADAPAREEHESIHPAVNA